MPARNVLKIYVEGGIYHVYNRGVDKRDIFIDDSDYKYFLWLLKTYLTPLSHQKGWHPFEGATLKAGAFTDEIELMAYCLMPNHFHLLIRQKNKDSMPLFMKCVMTNYSMYFNKKYDRVGTLFQGRYKAILINDNNYLLHLTRYIHLNPVSKGSAPFEGRTLRRELREGWSSYGEYLGLRKIKWVKPDFILDLLNQGVGTYGDKISSYKDFVEKYSKNSVTVSDVTSYTAKVRVTVTKDVEASVTFGNQGKFGNKAGSASISKTHEIKLENLEDASTYTYYVDVKDSVGNTARSETKSFTTPMDKTGPVIEQVKIDILPLGESDEYAQAIISWSTDKPSTTKVEYDEGVVGGKYGKASIEDESLNNSHTVIVKTLNPASSYHFRIVSRDKRSNETKSNDYNFVTPTKEKSILQLILKSLEETFSWVSNVGAFFSGLGKKGN